MNKTELLAAIIHAFPTEPRSPVDDIVYDNSGSHGEAEGIKTAFAGKSWQELPHALMLHEQSCLGFLSLTGYYHYLPAFLYFTVEDYEEADMIPDIVLSSLTLPTMRDIVSSAIDIGQYQMNTGTPNVDWNDILQNRFKSLDDDVHNFIARAALFNRDQSRVIYQFLVHLREQYGKDFFHDEPAIAIHRYWFQFA